MNTNAHDQDTAITLEDTRLLTRAARLIRSGRTPYIVFTQSSELSARKLDALADIAQLANRHAIFPIIENASPAMLLKLEVAALRRHFDVVDVPLAGRTDSPPVSPAPFRRLPSLLFTCVALAGVAWMLAGCTVHTSNSQGMPNGLRAVPVADVPGQVSRPSRSTNRCAPLDTTSAPEVSGSLDVQMPVHGPGDVIRIDIPDGADFSGTFAVNVDGSVSLPYAGNVRAEGRTSQQLAKSIEAKLTQGGYFHAGQLQVSVVPLRWSAMNVSVAGAVFQPGRAVINDPSAEKRDLEALTTIGDAPVARYIDAGLRAGAGIRPDADLSQVKLIRGGKTSRIDLTGLVTGLGTPDIPLMFGDRIEVPSSGCFHEELMRPSQATPPGMRVFMSNLTVPATGNNPSAVDNYATNLPYGTRLLQAATSSNCIGGASASNAARSVVLISNNPLTGKAEVMERSIDELIRNANRDDINPYLLPNDAMACYDSGVTNMREVARTMTEVLGPLGIVLGLL